MYMVGKSEYNKLHCQVYNIVVDLHGGKENNL
jgi:hypothetical protein